MPVISFQRAQDIRRLQRIREQLAGLVHRYPDLKYKLDSIDQQIEQLAGDNRAGQDRA